MVINDKFEVGQAVVILGMVYTSSSEWGNVALEVKHPITNYPIYMVKWKLANGENKTGWFRGTDILPV